MDSMNMDISNTEISIHTCKVSYEILDSILNKLKHTSRLLEGKDTITLYIDIINLLRNLYKEDIQEEILTLGTQDRWVMVAQIINIVGHYRYYFFSRMGKYTNIILYYSDKESNYCKEVDANYNRNYYNKHFRYDNDKKSANQIIINTIKMVKSFMEYIPYAYVINTGTVDPRAWVAYRVLNQNRDTDYSMILTNDDLYMDLLEDTRNDISILKVQGPYSQNIYLGNVIDYIFRKVKTKPIIESNNIIPLLMALTGSKEHNISYKSKMGPYRAYKYIGKLEREYNVDPNTNYTPEVLEMLVNDEKLIQNFKLTNSKNLAKNISEVEHLLINTQFIDTNNIQVVKNVCNKYFTKHDIIINFLFAGEEMK